MKKVPLGPKRVKLSYHHNWIDDSVQKEIEENKHHDFTKQVEKANKNENAKQINTNKNQTLPI